MKARKTSTAKSGGDIAIFALLAILLVAAAWIVGNAAGTFEADPDYIYTLNGLELLTFRSPSYYTHPGTPVEMLSALVIALTWLVSLPLHGWTSVQDQVLTHVTFYMRWINTALIACNAAALVFFACRVRAASGRLFPAVIGALSIFLFMSVLLAAHRISAEPLLLAGSMVLAGIVAPVAFAPDGFRETGRFAMAIGAAIGFCIAVKATAAPLLIMIFLLRGQRARMTAFWSCLISAVILTLPVAPHYVEMALWYVGLFTHQGGYGSGAVGVPSFSDLVGDARTLFVSTPETFVCLGLYVLVVAARMLGFWRSQATPIRVLAFCLIFVLVDFLLVLKQPEVRYTIPTVAFLCLGNAILAQCLFPRMPAWGGAILALTLAALGFWSGRARTEHLEIIRGPNEALLQMVDRSGCLELPYYSANRIQYDLFFGNGWTQYIYNDELARLYPDFITYDNNHNYFLNFAGPMTTKQALALFARQKCVYLVGSPMARFSPSFFPPEWISLVAQSPGSPGAAVAVYALKPGWDKNFPK